MNMVADEEIYQRSGNLYTDAESWQYRTSDDVLILNEEEQLTNRGLKSGIGSTRIDGWLKCSAKPVRRAIAMAIPFM